MGIKRVLGIGIVVMILSSFYYVIQLNLNMAMLSMVGLFMLTNAMRAKAFHDQGMEKQSKWMRWVTLFFGLVFFVLAVIIMIK